MQITDVSSHSCISRILGGQATWIIKSREKSAGSRILGSLHADSGLVSDNFHASGAARLCAPNNSAHISAHNAVKTFIPEEDEPRRKAYEQMRATQQARLDENYAKACKRAEKKGRKLPSKEEYYSHWGYNYYSISPWLCLGSFGSINGGAQCTRHLSIRCTSRQECTTAIMDLSLFRLVTARGRTAPREAAAVTAWPRALAVGLEAAETRE
jgi:hypothetical protein